MQVNFNLTQSGGDKDFIAFVKETKNPVYFGVTNECLEVIDFEKYVTLPLEVTKQVVQKIDNVIEQNPQSETIEKLKKLKNNLVTAQEYPKVKRNLNMVKGLKAEFEKNSNDPKILKAIENTYKNLKILENITSKKPEMKEWDVVKELLNFLYNDEMFEWFDCISKITPTGSLKQQAPTDEYIKAVEEHLKKQRAGQKPLIIPSKSVRTLSSNFVKECGMNIKFEGNRDFITEEEAKSLEDAYRKLSNLRVERVVERTYSDNNSDRVVNGLDAATTELTNLQKKLGVILYEV